MMGMFKVGDRVWFCGADSDRFSVRGEIDTVVPRTHAGVPVGVHAYGVRLENGNYKLAHPNQVRERGHGVTLRRLGDMLGPLTHLGRCHMCSAQHMSPNAMVGPGKECASCVRDSAR